MTHPRRVCRLDPTAGSSRRDEVPTRSLVSDVVIHLEGDRALVRALARRLTGSGYLAVVQAASWDIHVDAYEKNGTLDELLELVDSVLQGDVTHATISVDGGESLE